MQSDREPRYFHNFLFSAPFSIFINACLAKYGIYGVYIEKSGILGAGILEEFLVPVRNLGVAPCPVTFMSNICVIHLFRGSKSLIRDA